MMNKWWLNVLRIAYCGKRAAYGIRNTQYAQGLLGC